MKKTILIFTSSIFMRQSIYTSIISKDLNQSSSESKKTKAYNASSIESGSIISNSSSSNPMSINSSASSNSSRPKMNSIRLIRSNEPINLETQSKKNSNESTSKNGLDSSKTSSNNSQLSSIQINELKDLSSNKSNIESFLNQLPTNSITSLQKHFSEIDLIKNNEQIESQWQAQSKNFSTMTNHFAKIILDLEKKIKESKNNNEKIYLKSFKDLLSQLTDIFKRANTSIGLESSSFKTCQSIFMLSEKLKSTKNDFEEDLIKSKIKEIWYKFHLSQQKHNKSAKKTIVQTNLTPLNFEEDVYSIIDHAEKTIKKFKALNNFQTLCKELPEFFDSLQNLDLNNDISNKIIKFMSIISQIEIDNTLPHLTNIVIETFPILNDLLTLTILGSAIQFESINNAQHTGLTGFLKKKSTLITLIGAGSLRNTLMFSSFKVHPSNIVNNYSSYAHNWYTSNYRLPNIINKTSTEKRSNLSQILKLQKTLISKMIEVFTHNYKSKNLLTRKDCNYIEKLLYQLQLISNILIKTDSSLENIQYTEAQIDNIKFYLHGVFEDLAYLKRRPTYRPTSTFFESKKNREIESLETLLKEKSTVGIQRLSKILVNYFKDIKQMTIKNEEDPQDPVDNNLFHIKVNHNFIKKTKD